MYETWSAFSLDFRVLRSQQIILSRYVSEVPKERVIYITMFGCIQGKDQSLVSILALLIDIPNFGAKIAMCVAANQSFRPAFASSIFDFYDESVLVFYRLSCLKQTAYL